MKSTRIFVLILSAVLLISAISCVSAVKGKILFYEFKSNSKYKIDSGYSMLKDELYKQKYECANIKTEDLTKEKLKGYDVLVIPEVSTSLTSDELAAIFEFVMQEGKGLFVCGGSNAAANTLTIPFGITIDDSGKGKLLENSHPVTDTSGNYDTNSNNFVVTHVSSEPMVQGLKLGVSKLAFYEGAGIFLSGDAIPVVTSYSTTYSESGSFATGSEPPIAAAAVIGKGLVFVLSDADMLENTNLDPSKYRYDNLRFGTNIINWLNMPRPEMGNDSNCELVVGQLMMQVMQLNDSVATLETEILDKHNQNSILVSEKLVADEELAAMRGQRFMGFEYTVWAGLLVAVAIFGGIITTRSRKGESETDEESSDMGYEFEENIGIGGPDTGAGDFSDTGDKKK